MDHRQVASIAGGVQRGRSLGDVFPDDGQLADLAVAQAKLIMGEADRARLVGALRMVLGFREEGDAARWLAAGNSQAAMHAP